MDNEEKQLAEEYAEAQNALIMARNWVKIIEARMAEIKPIEEWKISGEGWSIRPTNIKTYAFEEDDSALRALADSPHISSATKKEVFRLEPVGVRALKSLASYGKEEEMLVRECLEVVGTKSRLSFIKKE